MGKAVEVVDGGEDIVVDDVLRNEDIDILADGVLQSFALILLHELAQDDAAHLFLDAYLGRIEIDIGAEIDHAVGEHADVLALDVEDDADDACVVDELGLVAGQHLALVGDDLAGARIDDRHCQRKACDTREEGELLIELIAADVGDIVAAAVKEQAVEQGLGGLHGGRIARTQLAVYLDQALVAPVGGVLLEGGDHALVLAEDLLDALVGDGADEGIVNAAEPGCGAVLVVRAHGLEEPGDGELAVLVDADVENVARVGLILQPRAVIRDDGGGIDAYHGLVKLFAEVDAGGTNDLRDYDALGAVDDEGTARSHDREIAHEDLLLLDLLGLLVAQADADLQGCGVRCVAGLALLLGVLGLLVHRVVDEAQLQIAGVVGDGIYILEHLAQSRFKEPLVGAFLDLQEVWHIHDLLGAGKALSQSLAIENIFRHWRTLLINKLQTHGCVVSFL